MGFAARVSRAARALVSHEPTNAEVLAVLEKINKITPGSETPPSPIPAYSMNVPIGYNSDTQIRSTEALKPDTLRSLAVNCDLIRIAIQMVKNQLRGLDWDITVVQGYDAKEWEARRQKIREFFRRPDPLNDFGFHDWFGAWLEDLLVLDAPSLLLVRDRAGRLISLSQIDGATIKPKLDAHGFVPTGKDIAYEQIINGRVVAEFTRRQLLYTPYTVQPNSPYGLPPPQMVIAAAHIALEREISHLDYYKQGTVPDYLIVAPKGWTGDQIVKMQQLLDQYLAGKSAARHRMKLIPAEFEPKPMKQPDFTVTIDEWLARIISGVYGVAPHLLLKQRTKQQADALETQQTYLGQHPLTRFFSEIMTEKVIRNEFNAPGLKFTWLSDKRDEQEFNLQRAKAMIPVGAVGIDELRIAEGKQPLGIPPYIQMPNGLLFLNPNVREMITNGKLDYVDAKGAAISLKNPPPPPAAQPNNPPAPAPQKPSAGQKELMVGELRKWRQCVMADLKRGAPIRDFECEFIPEFLAKAIRDYLDFPPGEVDPEAVKHTFGGFIERIKTDAL